jgi:hypothetical protein
LLLFDLANPDAFLQADRASTRIERVLALSSAHSWQEISDYVASHGLLGDYAVHALLFSMGGRVGTILAQVALLLLSAVAVFRLCETLGMSRRVCVGGAAFYLLLPHSVVFPHQLITEAIHVPLLVMSTWLTVLAHQRGSLGMLLSAAILLACATLIRPVTLLWPVVVGVALALRWAPAKGLWFATVAFAPIVLWMTFVWRMTGEFGLGESNASMGRNLYYRVQFISLTLPDEARADVEATYLNQGDRGRLTIGSYLSFGLRHPVPFVGHFARESGVFFLKSGIEKVTIDYLGGGEGFRKLREDPRGGWRSRLQQDGPYATFKYLWDEVGIVVVVSALGSILMVMWLCIATVGGWRLVRASAVSTANVYLTAFLLVVLPLYVFGVTQVVGLSQSRHRAPAEFALVVLGIYGVCVCLEKIRSRRNAHERGANAQFATGPRLD